MAGAPRAPSRLAQSNRFAPTRPAVNRALSSKLSLSRNAISSRQRANLASPTGSSISLATSQSRSPGDASARKRKERDFEDEDASHETNINVVVRCRGRNEREVQENSGVVLGTDGIKGSTVELSLGPTALSNKMYQFDKVFSPAADQSMVYDEVVKPMLGEMLLGYNCTIFAYGQTGTGKTYTMSGDMSDELGTFSDSAGIIPRALRALFAKLDAEGTESSVKCSFIELYNEELRDLLAAEEGTKLKIYDDAKKGHVSTIVQGMEECHIQSAADGIKLLQLGSQKRQVAATRCNDLSSRSHTIFTVTVYAKRTSDAGEEVVASGKLNLVDLAGSENIGRSGAENKRATEAGLINKSLLTLGRVINALVDKGVHIPYRESKLTRLLQDSLGGRTKTCIIATVSQAKANLEETVSTLDYAFRAKNIRNKPQMNATISKLTLLKEFTAEIEKLKSELIVTRQRNGVHLTNESYEELIGENESRRLLTDEQKNKIEVMELSLKNKVQELFALATSLNVLQKAHESVKSQFDDTQGLLAKTELVLRETNESLDEEIVLRKAHEQTEQQLQSLGKNLIADLGRTKSDIDGLWSRNKRKSDLQSQNVENWEFCQAQLKDVTRLVEMQMGDLEKSQQRTLDQLGSELEGLDRFRETTAADFQRSLVQGTTDLQDKMKSLHELNAAGRDELSAVIGGLSELKDTVAGHFEKGLRATVDRTSSTVVSVIDGLWRSQSQAAESYGAIQKAVEGLQDSFSTDRKRLQESHDAHARGLAELKALKEKQDESQLRAIREAAGAEMADLRQSKEQLIRHVVALVEQDTQLHGQRISNGLEAMEKRLQADGALYESLLSVSETEHQQSVARFDQVAKDIEIRTLSLVPTIESASAAATAASQTSVKAMQTIQEETLASIDQQVEHFSMQMQSMDEFVHKIRTSHQSQSSEQKFEIEQTQQMLAGSETLLSDSHQTTLGAILSAVRDGTAHADALRQSLAEMDQILLKPLAQLRADVAAFPFQKYLATGMTPARRTYHVPNELPRTNRSPLQIRSSAAQPKAIRDQPPAVYSDLSSTEHTLGSSVAVNEDDETTQESQDTSHGATVTHRVGLREVDPNANAVQMTPSMRSEFSRSLSFKRLPTSDNISAGKSGKKKKKTRSTAATMLAASGLENTLEMQVNFSRSTGGRRLRPREIL